MIELTMPRLGLTMEEGTLAEWHKQPGEPFEEGEPLFAVETDKATLDVEAETAGVLRELLVPVGGKVAVGTPIARIETAGEAVGARVDNAAPVSPPQAPAPSAAPQAAVAPVRAADATSETRVRTSPAARRRARELGIDLTTISGSGPAGRIILRNLPAKRGAPGASEPARAAPPGARRDRAVPLTSGRRAIAASMSEAAAIPQFRVMRTADLTRTLALQEALRPILDRTQTKLSVADFLIHACALALAAHPDVNASFVRATAASEAHIRVHEQVNIAIALALPDGLVAPVLRDADKLTLIDTARRRRELTDAARSGRLNAQQMTEATFTLSNLGPLGVDQFDAIVTPPQAAVLATGRVIQQPVVQGAADVQVRPAITLTVTADHRVIDGALAATFLGTIVKMLEEAAAYRLW